MRAGVIPDSAADWVTWSIPEYQDAQRFVRNSTDDYGPLACVVASPNLENLTAAQLQAGALVGIIYVDGSAPITAPYQALKLTAPGFYCILLQGTVTPPALRAYVVPSADRQCATPTSSHRITAHPQLSAATSASDYPPVARFMIMKSWRPGIGVRCLDRWCSLGVPSLGDVAPPAHGTFSTTAPGYVRHTVAGWFDQQEIAIPAAGRRFNLKATLRASVVPVDDLGQYELSQFNALTRVATIYFSDEPEGTKYHATWGLRAGSNSLGLRRTSGGWEVYVNGTRNPLLKVTHTDHSAFGMHIAGTARWAWDDDDEGIWVRCAEGCCKVDEL